MMMCGSGALGLKTNLMAVNEDIHPAWKVIKKSTPTHKYRSNYSALIVYEVGEIKKTD